MRKRGRPKGAEKTVIGLPSRKKRKGELHRVATFLKKSPREREKGWSDLKLIIIIIIIFSNAFMVC